MHGNTELEPGTAGQDRHIEGFCLLSVGVNMTRYIVSYRVFNGCVDTRNPTLLLINSLVLLSP